MVTETQMGILRDIGENKVALDDTLTDWMREHLIELIYHEPKLIDMDGPSVFLTEAGRKVVNA